MRYRAAGSTGLELSQLGYGCMRFTRTAGRVDQAKAEAELDDALARGVTYYDVAYTYPGCEEALGRWLARDGHRDRVTLATKMPHYLCKRPDDFDRYFAEQLSRLRTDHIDFYLIHMITSLTSWQRVVDLGICDWIEREKASGRIRHIGFSFHGGVEDFRQIVDAYPWEFCQIQLNYLDAHAQAGLEGLRYASEKGLPVIIMEPLRGGRLVSSLPPAALAAFSAADPGLTPADWGFQWLWNLPEVTCVLSGMNSLDQIRQNCDLADRVFPGSLGPASLAAYDEAIAAIRETERVGCTGCGYCMPCPHGVDIPTCFRCLNASAIEGHRSGFQSYVQLTTLRREPTNAGRCVGCGACLRKCPQGIAIPDKMAEVRREFEGPAWHLVNRFKGVAFKV